MQARTKYYWDEAVEWGLTALIVVGACSLAHWIWIGAVAVWTSGALCPK